MSTAAINHRQRASSWGMNLLALSSRPEAPSRQSKSAIKLFPHSLFPGMCFLGAAASIRRLTPLQHPSMECFFCHRGFSSRCSDSILFGSEHLDGGQAEYVRVPLADGTVIQAPSTVSDNALVLMADIWPTGFYGATSALKSLKDDDIPASTVVVIGCGPVGLCAIIAALEFAPAQVFAIDSVDSRLALAKSLGAEPLNFKTDRARMERRIKEASEGRGADVVIEVVGLSPALRTAFDIVRPFGTITSIGVHNAEVRKYQLGPSYDNSGMA
jgi:threonine dehydrogenase-like Zn-dependent dehydrogenase